MQFIVTYATGMYCNLPKISSEIQTFNFGISRTLYLREQGLYNPWLFFEAKRGPRAKEFGKHWLKRKPALA
jgi:hypothetical protein